MKFTEEHLWLLPEDDCVVVGVTAHAVEEIGEIVFVDLPDEGMEITKDDEVVVIESAESASDILAPMDGEIVDVNTRLTDAPGLINDDPQGDAWLFKMQLADEADMDELLTEAAYKSFVG